MEKRRYTRVPVYIETDLYSGGNSYAGFISNLSNSGLYVEASPTSSAIDFIPGTKLELEFQDPSGKSLTLDCEITRLYSKITPLYGLSNCIGMEIKDPPLQYKSFFKTLF